jgi:hypothetical protein
VESLCHVMSLYYSTLPCHFVCNIAMQLYHESLLCNFAQHFTIPSCHSTPLFIHFFLWHHFILSHPFATLLCYTTLYTKLPCTMPHHASLPHTLPSCHSTTTLYPLMISLHFATLLTYATLPIRLSYHFVISHYHATMPRYFVMPCNFLMSFNHATPLLCAISSEYLCGVTFLHHFATYHSFTTTLMPLKLDIVL